MATAGNSTSLSSEDIYPKSAYIYRGCNTQACVYTECCDVYPQRVNTILQVNLLILKCGFPVSLQVLEDASMRTAFPKSRIFWLAATHRSRRPRVLLPSQSHSWFSPLQRLTSYASIGSANFGVEAGERAYFSVKTNPRVFNRGTPGVRLSRLFLRGFLAL